MLGDFSTQAIISFLYVLPAIIISMAIHEFAHAFVAYKLGDLSQKNQGRLTISPFAHIDWFGFISLALVGFGWGKPVEVNTRNFKNPAKGMMLTAFAGPLSNILLAILLTILLKIFAVTGILDMIGNGASGQIFIGIFAQTIQMNIVFGIFNMLPIPPFDGAKILFYFLPYKFRELEFMLEKYSFVIIIVMLVTNMHVYIMQPFMNLMYMLINFIL
ncbi:MAG: site-2 protease family protein [Clostridia bacterium]